MRVRALADELEARLRAIGTPNRATGEKAYLKSDLDFTGTLVSDTREEVKRLAAGLALDHDQLIELASELWSRPVFERRLAAIMFLQRSPRLLSVADVSAPRAARPGVTDLGARGLPRRRRARAPGRVRCGRPDPDHGPVGDR